MFCLVVFLKKWYWGEHCAQTGGEMMPIFTWVCVPSPCGPCAGTAASQNLQTQESPGHHAVPPWAIPCPSCLLQHIQLPHQYLLLHPRANHPFLVASNLRSSTLGASTTYRNGPHFYVKCVQSSFKYSLNQAFIIEAAGGKSWKRISPLSFYSAIHFVQAGAEIFCVSQ